VLQQPRFPDTGRALSNLKEIHVLQRLGDLVIQQPRLPGIGRVLPDPTENAFQRFEDLVLQQPGFHQPYHDRVKLLCCSRLGSTQHNTMFGDLVLQQPRFSDAGRASANHKEIHALQSFGDLVLQQPRFLGTGRALPNHTEIHALQSSGDLVPGRRLLLARPRAPPCLLIFSSGLGGPLTPPSAHHPPNLRDPLKGPRCP